MAVSACLKLVASVIGVLFDVVGVIKEGPLHVANRRHRFEETTASMIPVITFQQKLLGEELIIFPIRKNARLAVQMFNVSGVKRHSVIVRTAVF